jgi:tRNA threonylcarbamoyladenosine biosynthesis protein TsaB
VAIETSGTTGSVAVFDGGQLLEARALDPSGRSARTLAPALSAILKHVGWSPRQVQFVAVGIGPGSFTGLRLGVMTAKAFAYGAGAKVLGIGTPESIAARVTDLQIQVAVAIDAQRGEVYSGRFTIDVTGAVQRAGEIEIITTERWLASLDESVLATGPALVKLAERLTPAMRVAPREQWLPDAASVGRLAALRAARGESDDLWSMAPCYLRRSAAEEKWESRAT